MPENMINLYDTRRMLNVLEQMPPSPKFLLRFQSRVIQSNTDTIDIDIVKGGQKIVPYTAPVKQGVVMERDGFETNSYKIPYIKVKMASEADKWLHRSAGDTPYTTERPATRAARALADDFEWLGKNLDAEEERQRAEAFFTGKVTIRNENKETVRVIKFGQSHTGSPTTPWTASTGFNDVLEFLRGKVLDITKTGAPAPTDIVCAGDVGNVLIRIFNPDAKTSYLSSFMVERGQIDIHRVEPGVIYLGYFRELGCNVWIYNGQYTDLDNTTKPFAPAGKLLMLSSNARYDMNYAAIQNFHANFAPVRRFPLSWIEPDGRARFLQLESAPLFAPHQIDSIGVFNVL